MDFLFVGKNANRNHESHVSLWYTHGIHTLIMDWTWNRRVWSWSSQSAVREGFFPSMWRIWPPPGPWRYSIHIHFLQLISRDSYPEWYRHSRRLFLWHDERYDSLHIHTCQPSNAILNSTQCHLEIVPFVVLFHYPKTNEALHLGCWIIMTTRCGPKQPLELYRRPQIRGVTYYSELILNN